MSSDHEHVTELTLKYGINPGQRTASVIHKGEKLPFEVLSGRPSYINILDALRGWRLVRELRERFGRPAAASFKHVNPAGVGLSGQVSPAFLHTHFLEDIAVSPVAEAYLRARQADRVSSYGDFVILSDMVDAPAAALLAKVVSDGVIAPGYCAEALSRLRTKRDGRYLVLEIDPTYRPEDREFRTEFGITLTQDADVTNVPDPLEANIVSKLNEISSTARDDLLLATIVAKHTQSNAVVLASGGQTIGIGAGQQSRISATEIACQKADRYRLLFHPALQCLSFTASLSRVEKMNLVDSLVRFEELDSRRRQSALANLQCRFVPLSPDQRQAWLSADGPICLASDGFIPFRDNVDRAAQSGVTHIVQPGGSVRDEPVTEAADDHGIVMLHTGQRYFLH
jgi:phosphoribosylaminoimidazolecarboxamide formyltransferase/IMP cyclohydrolase